MTDAFANSLKKSRRVPMLPRQNATATVIWLEETFQVLLMVKLIRSRHFFLSSRFFSY
jgi:gluconate kinase